MLPPVANCPPGAAAGRARLQRAPATALSAPTSSSTATRATTGGGPQQTPEQAAERVSSGVDRLSGRLDDLSARVGRLAQQLAAETAATRLSSWASRHPPQSDFVREIAEGNTGSVHEVSVAHSPGARVAVKRIAWSTHEQRLEVAKRVATEISVLQSLEHPLLPTLHQVYTTGSEICLEMTLCSRGTLWHERQEMGGTLPLDLVRQYASELVCVLAHLHDAGVVYADLKPENVLVQDCGHIMLCDMDLAHTRQEVEQLRLLETASAGSGAGPTFWGTLEYVAPEVALRGAAAYSPASDWWGLGVLVYELLLGLTPWDGGSEGAVLEQIKGADVLWPPEGVLDREAEDLIRGFLTWDPTARLGSAGVHQIQRHPFFAAVNWGGMEAQVRRDQQASEETQQRQHQEGQERQGGGGEPPAARWS